MNTNRWEQPKLEQTASDFWAKKYLTGNPVSMYAAFRIWNDYLKAREPRDRKTACENFVYNVSQLIRSFHETSLLNLDNETGKAKNVNIAHRYFSDVPQEDTRLTLWFPDSNRSTECASVYSSFYPLIIYYPNRLNDWELCFRQCKVCGRYFLAKSQRYELCSEKCKKAQALQRKKAVKEKAASPKEFMDWLYQQSAIIVSFLPD